MAEHKLQDARFMNSSPAIEPKQQKSLLELTIGSNIFRNTNGVLKIQGREQIVLQVHPEDNELLLTMDFYDGAGAQVAHLRRNTWAFNQAQRFALDAGPPHPSLFTRPAWLKLTDSETGEVALEASVMQEGKIQVLQGKFYTHKGTLVEITSHVCRIGTAITLFGDVFEHRGGAAVIG
ncbi:MAG: hypothetical protein ACT4OO_01845 [Nitrospiraceae bacterium]